MNIKRWLLPPLDRDRALRLSEEAGISPLLGALLMGRGFDAPEKIQELFGDSQFSNPFLMKDMALAVQRIRRAIGECQRIAVYGDYDADGVTSTAMLYTYLHEKGARVSFYIPQREGEGYGMNLSAVDTLSREGVNLIITVDNGISAIDEIAHAGSLGIDVVVTDHHQPHPQLPNACAIVDPHQEDDKSPFKDFSGAGVVLKLLMALQGGEEQDPAAVNSVLDRFCGLAAVGTVGDSVPLLGENRLLVKLGLRVIDQGRLPGLSAILGAGREKASSTKLAFSAVPCINATGRMGSPDRAVRLLTHNDPAAAGVLAKELKGENTRRKEVEAEILRSAVELAESDAEIWAQRVIVVAGEGWHMGVVGIVAARLTERFGKPCIVLTTSGGGEYRGSGRSVEGFSMFDAINHCRELLVQYGGHPMAAGLTVREENISILRRRLNEYAKERYPSMPVFTLCLDCSLKPQSITAKTVRELLPLEPYGTKNAQPIFGIYDVTLRGVQTVGTSGGHTRLLCVKDGCEFTVMRFGISPKDLGLSPGDVVDLAVNLQLSEYQRGPGFDFIARDIRLSGLDPEAAISDYRLYESYLRNEELGEDGFLRLMPQREHFAALYRHLAANADVQGQGGANLPGLCLQLSGAGINLGRMMLMLDVLAERGLIHQSINGDSLRYTLLQPKDGGKADLAASPLLQRLNIASRKVLPLQEG